MDNIRNDDLDHNGIPTLKAYYITYLKNVRRVSDSSVKHYLEALKYISKYLKSKSIITEDIFEISDLDRLSQIQRILSESEDYMEVDERGHRMYSVGFNHYMNFASGKDALPITEMDIPIPKSSIVTRNEWNRSNILKNQVLNSAEYKCEMDENHLTFISERTNKPYMEGHHALPLRLQDRIDVSLDVYANIVCLCPICHRRIHYGVKSDKKDMIQKIYHERCDRLNNVGIRLSDSEFMDMILE